MPKSRRRPSKARKRTKRARSIAAAHKRMRLLATSLVEHSDRTANSLLIMKEETRDTGVLESSHSSPSDSQLKEMRLSSEFNGHLVKVKLEPPDVPCLPEEPQTRQQHCIESSPGGLTAGMGHVKEEPREESSDEHPILEVKTEPYNIEISAEQDQMGRNRDSTSEGAKESTGMLPLNDKLGGASDHASSGSTSSNAPFKICTEPFEPQLENTAQVTTNSLPTEQPSDQTETQQGSKLLMFGHQGDKLYTCDVCSATCIDVGHLEVHPKTGETKTFSCNTCSATFLRAPTLRVRADRPAGEGSSYKCNLYPAEVSRSMHPRRNKRAHTGKKRYKCDLCPADFSRHTSLWNHKQIHRGRRYKCDLCPAHFSRSAALVYHKRKHTGEKLYKCDLCPAAFTQGAVLLYHRRMHTGEKPFKCHLCPAEFTRSTNLSCHRRTHTGEKPFKCDLCPAEFTRNANLSYHKRKHRVEKPNKCDLCPAEFSHDTNLLYSSRKTYARKALKSDL
ncbi:zinc finger protein 808-like isoform X2 [Ornithodoros turicata]|uniref:zinc finger protein 808-like isoform X2 n=1 Tax=Ornithodoros turicata TaxID=34597 RepID=UPI003138A31C